MHVTFSILFIVLQIENTVISLDLLEEYFLCDLTRCLGACCIEGDAGAPLEESEVQTLETLLPIIQDDLTPQARQTIETQGVSYIDQEGDRVTTLVDGKACVFASYEPGGSCKCVWEKAFRAGKIPFPKPISCHLYPVRVKQYSDFTAVNLHKWKICKSAFSCGHKAGVKAYRFLKEPLVRKFGAAWYEQLEIAANELQQIRQHEKQQNAPFSPETII